MAHLSRRRSEANRAPMSSQFSAVWNAQAQNAPLLDKIVFNLTAIVATKGLVSALGSALQTQRGWNARNPA